MESYTHQPVLLDEIIDALAIKPNGIYIDATFGRGGHSQAILNKLNADGRLLALDKDLEAAESAQNKFKTEDRFKFLKGSFTHLLQFAREEYVEGKVNGILMDLGVSSPQLDNPGRGFSFLQDGPLDMRMDTQHGEAVATWLNRAKETDIAQILHEYGEERYARRIARAIVRERAVEPIQTTGRLAAIVSAANPAWERHKHPATRTFQALRIFINQELSELQTTLEQALSVLAEGGRLVVVSFHSLEDRIVKRFIRKHSKDESLPVGLPVLASNLKPKLKSLGRSIRPSDEEIARNPRSRSAILRVAEKLS
jgi:16S rRNA (cytosine1402-N4)-methyltransferase